MMKVLTCRFVNTRKRFLAPIISEIQHHYGRRSLDSIKTKQDLYKLLNELRKVTSSEICNMQWMNAFLDDENGYWTDEEA